MRRCLTLLVLGALGTISTPGAPAQATSNDGLGSPWVRAENARVRLVAGRAAGGGRTAQLVAGVEIELADGWKTYWRNPGSSGVPPRLTWDNSRNLASARLLFPAPDRFVDRDGDTIGYKHSVIFPLELAPADAGKPVDLDVTAEFGVCKEICIPVELKLTLTVPPDTALLSPSAPLATALDRVPRPAEQRHASDPTLTKASAELSGPKPRLVLEAQFPGSARSADIFAEAPDGLWVPLPKRTAELGGDRVRFEVDLTDGADLAELKGKTLRLTLVSASGQSEASFRLE